MVYEWDEKRARRAYWIRKGLGFLIFACVTAIPVWVAATLIR
ncbi:MULTISPECIES: hypothetical protein [Rhizobium/Agrobacterium group]|uniref:Transmembrane protein n=2 Tax=Neorhizobium TaxID=1525371 RepID=A0ABV0LVM0_9HYPH|nr:MULTISPECIES: hypothetical protein [Rhizobium/Agrobacterium group]WGI68851.1 hypothetical protein QEO92_01790 [Neorhizobium petrolearium]